MKQVLRKVLGGIFLFLCLIFSVSAVVTLTDSRMSDTSIGIGMIVFAVIFLVFGILLLRKKTAATDIKLVPEERAPGMKKPTKVKRYFMQHEAGLPLVNGVNCNMVFCENQLEIISGSTSYFLDISKILDVGIKTDAEIQQAYVSSAGGAVAGALLLGPLGAIVGGRAKKKTVSTKIEQYLIILYQKNENEIAQISFGNINHGIHKEVQALKQRLSANAPSHVTL